MMQKNIPPSEEANPQGKGLVTVLAELDSRRPENELVQQRPLRHLLQSYAVSRLILCAEFKFKPAVGNDYYLFAHEGRLRLSLIGPSEWRDKRFGQYLLRCRLEPDMTWCITSKISDSAKEQLAFIMDKLRLGLLSDLFGEQAIKTSLPFCDDRLPFHQRVLAKSLANHVEKHLYEDKQRSFLSLARENDLTPLLLPGT